MASNKPTVKATTSTNPNVNSTSTPTTSTSTTTSLISTMSTSYASLKKNDDMGDDDYYYYKTNSKSKEKNPDANNNKNSSQISGTTKRITQPVDPLRAKIEKSPLDDDNANDYEKLPQSLSYSNDLKSLSNADAETTEKLKHRQYSVKETISSYGQPTTTMSSVTRRSVSKPPPTSVTAMAAKNKNATFLSAHSAPPSELASPVISKDKRKLVKNQEKERKAPNHILISNTDGSNNTVISTGANTKEDMFSIFSGLKDRLARVSAESREILDRRVFKSGSADGSKATSSSIFVDTPIEGDKLSECGECEMGIVADGSMDSRSDELVKGCSSVGGGYNDGVRNRKKSITKLPKVLRHPQKDDENVVDGGDNDVVDEDDGFEKIPIEEGISMPTTSNKTVATSSSSSSSASNKLLNQPKETEMMIFKQSTQTSSPNSEIDDDDFKINFRRGATNSSFDISRLMKLVQSSNDSPSKKTFTRKWSGEDNDDVNNGGLITPEAAVEAFNLSHLYNSATSPDLKSKRFSSQLFRKSDSQRRFSKGNADIGIDINNGTNNTNQDSRYANNLINPEVAFSGTNQKLVNPFTAGDKKETTALKPSSSISLTFSSLLSRQKSSPKLLYSGTGGSAVDLDPTTNQQQMMTILNTKDDKLNDKLNKKSDSRTSLAPMEEDNNNNEYYSTVTDYDVEELLDTKNRRVNDNDDNDNNDDKNINYGNDNLNNNADDTQSHLSSPIDSKQPPPQRKSKTVRFVESVTRFQKFRKKFVTKLLFYVLIVLTWVLVPLPPYLGGFLGGVLATILFYWVAVVFEVIHSVFFYEDVKPEKEAIFANEEKQMYYRFGDQWTPDIKESKNVDDCFKGWLNELPTTTAAATAATTTTTTTTLSPPYGVDQDENSISDGTNDNTSLLLPSTPPTATTAAATTAATSTATYNPNNYHISSTVSVFATLEGSNLRLQTPKQGIPKRALWSDDSYVNVTFVKQRHYNLINSKVTLLPANLVSKRLWSKKYPIAIELAAPQQQQQQPQAPTAAATTAATVAATAAAAPATWGKKGNFATQLIKRNVKGTSKPTTTTPIYTSPKQTIQQHQQPLQQQQQQQQQLLQQQQQQQQPQLDSDNVSLLSHQTKFSQASMSAFPNSTATGQSKELARKTIFLFARTSRDKEEWYRRLRAASLGQPWPTKFTDIVQNMSSVVGLVLGGNTPYRCKVATKKASSKKPPENNPPATTNNDTTTMTSSLPGGGGGSAVSPSSTPATNSTTTTIDYSKLSPEMNLLYYAQFMSRTIGKPALSAVPSGKSLSSKNKPDEEDKVKKSKPDGGKKAVAVKSKNPFSKGTQPMLPSNVGGSMVSESMEVLLDDDQMTEEDVFNVTNIAAAAAEDQHPHAYYHQAHSYYHRRHQQQQQQQQQQGLSSSNMNLMVGVKSAFDFKDAFDNFCDPQLLWLNTLISRLFMDFLRERYWVEKIREKIEKKLSKIHIPYIMDQLVVTGIALGSNLPYICKSNKPYLDDRGFWVDLGISYPGGFCITMETKCNLLKLKHPKVHLDPQPQNIAAAAAGGGGGGGAGRDADSLDGDEGSFIAVPRIGSTVETPSRKTAALDSDEEDSAESSTDDEAGLIDEDDHDDDADKATGKPTQPIGKRILKFVDRLSQSKYFQQAAEYKYIKRALEEVSNTRLELNVEVKSLVGTLAINIPPPPTDRLWYGFRGNPTFVMAARPRVGLRELSLKPITDWIENKLALEFQRSFVMPNMDDFKIPLMMDHIGI